LQRRRRTAPHTTTHGEGRSLGRRGSKFSNKEALIRNFRWYLENLGKFENASGVSHRVPWKQGAVGALKRFF
jgi:hypothetical protein